MKIYDDQQCKDNLAFGRPSCVVRDEKQQVWSDVMRIEALRKQKAEQHKNAILKANLQFLRQFGSER